MVMAELTLAVNGVVTVVVPAEKSATFPETQFVGEAVWEDEVLHSALVFHDPARLAPFGIDVASGSQ